LFSQKCAIFSQKCPLFSQKCPLFLRICPLFFKEYSLLSSCLSFILDVARHNKKNGKQTAQQANTIYAGSND